MAANITSGLPEWLRQPASWLALIASIISIATFYLVHANKGEIEVIIPDRVGVRLDHNGDLSVLIPLTLTNTGSPRTVRHVRRTSVALHDIDLDDKPNGAVALRWRGEFKYAEAEEGRYPDDDLDYVNRAVPFALFGGLSTQRVFEFVQVDDGFPSARLQGFSMSVTAFSEDRRFTSFLAHYQCKDVMLAVCNPYRYCEMASSSDPM